MSVLRSTTLTEELARAHLDELVALDEGVRAELGAAFADDPWNAEHFLHDLPSKWELSVVALQGNNVCGYWVQSRKGPGWAHTHRVAVAGPHRGAGLGSSMFRDARERAGRLGTHTMTLTVARSNAAASSFYERLGFRVIGSWPDNSVIRSQKLTAYGYEIPNAQRRAE